MSLKCGYQRLRKALLWNDSKLQDAFHELMVCFLEAIEGGDAEAEANEPFGTHPNNK